MDQATKQFIEQIKRDEAGQEYKGEPISELRRVFNLMTNQENWKLPLYGEIPLADIGAAIVAAEFFAGSELRMVGEITPRNTIIVSGPGYYRCIGA